MRVGIIGMGWIAFVETIREPKLITGYELNDIKL